MRSYLLGRRPVRHLENWAARLAAYVTCVASKLWGSAEFKWSLCQVNSLPVDYNVSKVRVISDSHKKLHT
jgi:hypothetical protein